METPPKSNYKLTLCYEGTRYHGWEKKPKVDTIQGRIENVLSRMTGEEVSVQGASRTDAGVHAEAMVANVWLCTDKAPEEIENYLNRYLPEDIACNEVRPASPRFHARLRSVGKVYRYQCYLGPGKPVFDRRRVVALEGEPNVKKMRSAAKYLVGEQDFKSLCGNPRMKKSTVRKIHSIDIRRRGAVLTFTVHGNGFLMHMVRILVGTLLEVGYGRLAPEDMERILEARERKAAGPTAPAKGLCLVKVEY